MIRQRVRIRFRKEGDLRWIGHLDLQRTFERLFRRANLKLSMSEGFHPKPRVTYPSALGLGIVGADEVMELELAEQVDADTVIARLNANAPRGLSITGVRLLGDGDKKAQVETMSYEFPVPSDKRAAAEKTIGILLSQSSFWIRRQGRDEPIDMFTSLDGVELAGDVLRFTLRASRNASVRPREVLQALGLADLEDEGSCLTRTKVEIASAESEKTTT